MKTAIFGGSFNPPHVSHVLAVSYVLSVHDVDQVLVVPVFQHVFGKSLTSFEHRVAMCRLAVGWLPGVVISEVEKELGGESRTLNTLQALAARDASLEMRLVIGADVLSDLHKWYRWDEVQALAPPIVLGRAGHDHEDAPNAVLPEVSSTEVRSALAAGQGDDLAPFVPRRVLAYIRDNRLYL